MSFWCKLLGHRWKDVEGKCEQVCDRCGQGRPLPCDWHHCACKRCGTTRDEQHDWMYTTECEQVCRVCGQEREHHRWQPMDRGVDKCRHCGKIHKLTPEEIEARDEEWSNQFE